MNEKLVAVLNEILQDFIKTYQPDSVISNLRLFDFLTVDECDKINACITSTEKFLHMFELLKAKPDETFKILQETCIKSKWMNLFNLIKKKLKHAQREDLCMSLVEQQEHHKTFIYGFRNLTSQFIGREEYLKNIHDFFNQKDPTVFEDNDQVTVPVQAKPISHVVIISGLSGMGKTQLCITYINKHRLNFDSIVWLNAESESALTTSVYDLASRLDIEIKNCTLNIAIYKIFKKLLETGTKHLAIFDNADELKIEEFVSDISQNIFVLITSRRQSWPNSNIINLDVLTDKEAEHFILQSLNMAKKENDDTALKLATILDFFPLALQQATAYIKRCMECLKTYTIENYLAEYGTNEKCAKKLLSCKLAKQHQDVSLATTFCTWEITFNKIKNSDNKETTKECQSKSKTSERPLKTAAVLKNTFEKMILRKKETSLPLKFLYIMAYLASDNIPTTLFLEGDMTAEDPMSLICAIEVLKDYCFVSLHNGMLMIHKIVQLFVQLHLAEEKKSAQFITAAIQLLIKKFPYDKEELPAVEQKRILLPHLVEVKSHLEKAGEENLFRKQKLVEFQYSLLQRMSDTYWNFGDMYNNRKVCEELLQIQQKYYGPNHFQLAVTLSNLGEANRQLGIPQTSKSLLERALAIQEVCYGSGHTMLAATLLNLSNVHKDLGDFQTSKSLIERALAIQERNYKPNHIKLAITFSNLAVACRDLGDTHTSKSHLEKALSIQEGYYDANHFLLVATLINLANVYRDLGDSKTSRSLLERALAIQEHHYSSDHFQLAVTLSNLAVVHRDLGDVHTSKSLLERTLAIEERHYGHEHFQLASTLSNLSNAHKDLGDPETSKDLLERALAIRECHYGPDHIELAVVLSNLGSIRRQLGEPLISKILIEKALAIQERHYGPDHIQLAAALLNLANVYNDLGNPQNSKSLLKRALDIQERHYGSDHFQLAVTLSDLGDIIRQLGDPLISKSLIEKALAIQERHYGPEHFQLTPTISNLANVHRELGDSKTSKSFLERALAIEERHYGPNHFKLAATVSKLANIHRDLGDFQTFVLVLERALTIEERHYGSDHFQIAVTLTNLENVYRELDVLKL